MPKNEPSLKYTRFKGINNAERATRLQPDDTGAGWLLDAQNVDVDDSFGLDLRPGFAAVNGAAFTSAYATRDEQRLYIVSGGALQRVDSVEPWATTTLKTGLPGTELQWCEAGDRVFFAGDAAGIIDNGQCLPFGIPAAPAPGMIAIGGSLPAGRYMAACVYQDEYGREGGAVGLAYIEIGDEQGIQFDLPEINGYTVHLYVTTANGESLYRLTETTESVFNWYTGQPGTVPLDPEQVDGYPLPDGADVLGYRDSRIWASVYDPAADASYIHRSKPFFYHLFGLFDYIPVPGRVLMLAEVKGAMVIGTDREIHAYSDEVGLDLIASYGVVPGQPAIRYGDNALFWTQRGVCTALPFSNLTDTVYSVPPGRRCGVGIREADGRKILVVLTDEGGTANNPY